MKWSAFRSWLSENNQYTFDCHGLCDLLHTLQDDISQQAFLREAFVSSHFQQVLEAFEKFTESSRGPQAQLWESYLSMVELFLHFIRSYRTGDWSLHKACLGKMLPWMSAYNHCNYSRYLTVYLWDMLQLHVTHPDVEQKMLLGEFAVQRSEGKPFSQIPIDQTVEQTINKESKTPGGIIGLA